MEFKCGKCEKGYVRPTKGVGRFMLYTQEVSLPVPDDLEVSTCDSCNEHYTDSESAKTFQETMWPIYVLWLKSRVEKAVTVLQAEGFTIRDLEIACFVRPGTIKRWLKWKKPSINEAKLRFLEIAADRPSSLGRYVWPYAKKWSPE